MTKMETLRAAVEEQLKGVNEASNLCEAAWDLVDAVANEDEATLVLEDFAGGLSIKDAEKAVHTWCNENRGTASVAGCPRYIARREIRKAFGLPTEDNAGKPMAASTAEVKPAVSTNTIDFMSLL